MAVVIAESMSKSTENKGRGGRDTVGYASWYIAWENREGKVEKDLPLWELLEGVKGEMLPSLALFT